MGREDQIKLIAYKIWQEEECIDGHDCEHWFRAEAIWEQQQKEKTIAESSEIKPKQTVKRKSKRK